MLKSKYFQAKRETISFEDYLELAKKDSSVYSSPAERMLRAIGEPNIVDTSKDPRLSRIFGNRVIRTYDVFKDFYGLETVIERIVAFFIHAAQGLEESRQILYLLGPVGSAKSSLAERLKSLMEKEPVYVLKGSPINESPLGLLSPESSEETNIPERYLSIKPSPWALKRLQEYDGDLSRFEVERLYPSQSYQVGISKTAPGDDNSQDLTTLVGKLDIRKLEHFAQSDPDAYSFSGALCHGNRGLFEFVEMFKAPIKILHPLLTATQEKVYDGSEEIGEIPFDGLILAHSNESEWITFKQNKNNEAFLDRVFIVEVPYCLRIEEEIKIYQKMLNQSDLKNHPAAPGTLEMLAQFSVLSRLDLEDGSGLMKVKVYNGENVKEKDLTAKSYQEYKKLASRDEGFSGISTRLAYKILAQVYNYDPAEIAADPVHLLAVLHSTIHNENFGDELTATYTRHVEDYLHTPYIEKLEKDIQTAYIDSYDEYGQTMFDRYVMYADHYIQDVDFKDPDTNAIYKQEVLNDMLTKIEKAAKISNPKDFRSEVVNYCLRYGKTHGGDNPDWKSYEKLRQVIEANMFNTLDEVLPIISFSGQRSKDEKKKHDNFVKRMTDLGYTEKQVRRVVEWYMRSKKA